MLYFHPIAPIDKDVLGTLIGRWKTMPHVRRARRRVRPHRLPHLPSGPPARPLSPPSLPVSLQTHRVSLATSHPRVWGRLLTRPPTSAHSGHPRIYSPLSSQRETIQTQTRAFPPPPGRLRRPPLHLAQTRPPPGGSLGPTPSPRAPPPRPTMPQTQRHAELAPPHAHCAPPGPEQQPPQFCTAGSLSCSLRSHVICSEGLPSPRQPSRHLGAPL